MFILRDIFQSCDLVWVGGDFLSTLLAAFSSCIPCDSKRFTSAFQFWGDVITEDVPHSANHNEATDPITQHSSEMTTLSSKDLCPTHASNPQPRGRFQRGCPGRICNCIVHWKPDSCYCLRLGPSCLKNMVNGLSIESGVNAKKTVCVYMCV